MAQSYTVTMVSSFGSLYRFISIKLVKFDLFEVVIHYSYVFPKIGRNDIAVIQTSSLCCR